MKKYVGKRVYSMKALINGRLILEDVVYKNKVLLFDDKIREIIDNSSFELERVTEIIDVQGQYISPGFIDLHIHGSGGFDTMDGSLEALMAISSTILRYGTTSFLPTTMTMKLETIYKALDKVREALTLEEWQGARILGAHLEGPFINKSYKGAQREDHILNPEFEYIKDYLDIIRIITLAPEIEGAREFIRTIKEKSRTVLSIGHTSASYEEAIIAIEEGVSHCTHLFNAMTPLHHRSPGVVGAVFNSSITCELIADKLHVHPELFKLLLKIKGDDSLVLVTDAIRASCMKAGCYDLGGQEVCVNEGRAQLANGSLAGSVLTLNKAVKNFIDATSAPINQVIKLVTLNPARVIGVDATKGSIQLGKDSDIIVFNDDIDINRVFVEGNCLIGG